MRTLGGVVDCFELLRCVQLLRLAWLSSLTMARGWRKRCGCVDKVVLFRVETSLVRTMVGCSLNILVEESERSRLFWFLMATARGSLCCFSYCLKTLIGPSRSLNSLIGLKECLLLQPATSDWLLTKVGFSVVCWSNVVTLLLLDIVFFSPVFELLCF